MRKLVIGLALAVAALAISDYLAWRTDHRRLLALAENSGLRHRQPDIDLGLKRETVSARAAALLAWRLLDLEIDRAWLSELPASEKRAESQRGPDRLRLARELAEEVLSRQPASWQAATVVGASRYLEASRRHRQDQPIAAWREPLLVAMRLAPAYPEPPALLAAAYLSRWSSLSRTERQELPAVLTRAFEDSRSLQLLIPAWVRRAPSLSQLLEPIPDRPAAWLELGREFQRLGDLERFAIAHRRRLDSLPAHLADRVDRGQARLRGGHVRGGIALLTSVFSAPPDLAYADSIAAALAALPDITAAHDAENDLLRWLQWADDLCAVGRCPLDAETAALLARATDSPGSKLRPAVEAELPRRSTWPRDGWRRRGATYRLRLNAARTAREIRLELAGVPAAGAAMELRWDGRFLGVATVAAGEPVVWRFSVTQGSHLLEVGHLSGRPLLPVTLSLGPAAS